MASYLASDSPPASKIAASQDILMEILSRVPARSLFRFQCVCRQWRHLISDDDRFAFLHTRRNPTLACSGLFSSSLASANGKKFGFFWIGDNRRFTPPPSALSFLESTFSRILQSCNGLLLCSSSHSDRAYFVCNPVLRRVSEFNLPDEVAGKRNQEVLGLTLVFDPSRWRGFKVICAWSRAIDMYSSVDPKWERLPDGAIQKRNLAFPEGVYWNGKVIWLRKPRENFGACSHSGADPDSVILDLKSKEFEQLKLPCDGSMVCYFGGSMGHLNLATKNHESFNFYEMGEDMKWELKFRVVENVMRTYLNGGYGPIGISVWDGSWILNVVRTEEDGEEEDGYLVLWYLPAGAGRVVSYNCKTNLISCLSECNPGKTFQFIENLYWI